MDLLAPCRSCLQWLPFFRRAPPPPPLSSSHQHPPRQSPSLADNEAELPVSVTEPSKSEAIEVTQRGILTKEAGDEGGAPQPPDPIIIAEPVSAAVERHRHGEGTEESGKADVSSIDHPGSGNALGQPSQLAMPFINDVDFSTAGLKPPPSPMTPAPFGSTDHEKSHGHGHDHHASHGHDGHGGHGHGHGGHGHGHGGHGHGHDGQASHGHGHDGQASHASHVHGEHGHGHGHGGHVHGHGGHGHGHGHGGHGHGHDGQASHGHGHDGQASHGHGHDGHASQGHGHDGHASQGHGHGHGHASHGQNP